MRLMSDETRTYRVSGFQLYFMLAVLVILTATAPLVVLSIFRQGEDTWFAVIWLAILAWFWFNALVRVAHRIDVSGEDVEFRTIARSRRTSLNRIRSIRSSQLGGHATIRFDEGRFDVFGAIDGWHDFITRVKAANPAVELKGI
jgi:hypothetical protein